MTSNTLFQVLALAMSMTLLPAMAQQKAEKHSHSKTQKAHDHGAAQIDIAIEGKTAEVEFHAPAMGIVGFEHVATSGADKKKQADALSKFKADIAKMIVFDSTAKCTVSSAAAKVEQEEPDHSEIDGDFKFACAESLAGKTVRFAITKSYPSLNAVKVQVVAAGGSTGAEIKNDQGSVTIPR